MTINQVVRSSKRPDGNPIASDFLVEEIAVPKQNSGQLLCQTRYISLDPYLRSRLAGRHLSASINPGMPMESEVIAEIVAGDDNFKPGTLIRSRAPWQTLFTVDAAQVSRINPHIAPPSLALGVAGMPGLTAYAGIERLAELREGNTLVVSAASGPVGSMVGQLAKFKGCHVVGIAGSSAKCDWAVQEAGFDACINYREQVLRDALDEHCPNGIDVYFDNVGGDVLCAVMERLALKARVVLCGLITAYNQKEGAALPPQPSVGLIIRARATVRGLVVYDHEDLRQKFEDECVRWVAEGQLSWLEDVSVGLETAPEAFCRLMRGENHGKALVAVKPAAA